MRAFLIVCDIIGYIAGFLLAGYLAAFVLRGFAKLCLKAALVMHRRWMWPR